MPVRHNITFAALFAALISSAAPATGGELRNSAGLSLEHVPALRTDALKPVLSTLLRISAAPEERLIVPDTCEADGERELIRMAVGGAVEEAFAFLPSLCLWIDVGFDQTPTTIRIDRRMVDALARGHRRVVVYHTHPGAPARVVGYLPAYLDLIGAVLVNARYHDAPDVEIRHRAVTSIGVLEYMFRPSEAARRALDAIHRSGLGDFAGENLSLIYRAAAHEAQYYAAARACEAESGGRLDRFAGCFPMMAGDFVLEFRGLTASTVHGELPDHSTSMRPALRSSLSAAGAR